MATVDFNQEVTIKIIPLIGNKYKTKDFSIEIIGKKPSKVFEAEVVIAKVLTSSTHKYSVGQVFEAEEIAFYSDHYQIFI